MSITPNAAMIQISNISWRGVLIRVEVRKKGSGSDGLHVRNQLTLNDKKLICLRSHIWIQSLCFRLPPIYTLYLELIITSRKGKKKKTDADTDRVQASLSNKSSV